MLGSKTKKKTLVLLDAHAILHRAFHALPSFTSPSGEPTGALYGFSSMLLRILKEFDPDYIAACYDLPKPTFRHEFYEKYKAQRPETSGELIQQIDKSKEILKTFGIPVYEKGGFEADDVLASIVWQMKSCGTQIIIVTGDLDTLQLVRPGVKVYTMKKGVKDTILYDEEAVEERFGFGPKLLPDFKGLAGDPSDNIPGVKGVGEKTAKTLIQNFGTVENIYKNLKSNRDKFEKIGIKERVINILDAGEEDARLSKALAETRADVPISFSLKDSNWRADFSRKNIEEFFRQLGFKSLIGRIPGAASDFVSQAPVVAQEDKKELKELKVAFWLLDSRRINSSLEEIFAHSKTDNISDAKKKLLSELKDAGILKLFNNVEKPLTDVLSEMEKRGIKLDTVYLKKLSGDYHRKLKKLESEIWQLAGDEFNVGSPKQLSEILFEKLAISRKGLRRTAGGAFSTRFSELEKIKDAHPIIDRILSYRELAKLVSTYIDNLPSLVGKDGRLHTSFNQTGTTTGRLSSSDPNLQNIPVKTESGRKVRHAFVSSKGWKLVSFDYSQIELRIAASLSGDKKLKEAFRKGEDIHNRVASEVFNVPFGGVTSDMRRRAKIINFGILYGMGINSLKKNLDCSRDEASDFYREYFNDFAGMADYVEEVKKETAEKGYTVTFFNRRRYLPEITSPIDFIRKEAERMAVNAPVQGTAADVIKIAMIEVEKVLSEEKLLDKVKLLLQIHDELLFEIKDDTINKATPLIKSTMEKIVLPGVSLVVEVIAGDNWGDLKN